MTATLETEGLRDDRAWDRQDVATYLRICLRQLTDLRHEDPTFPAPRMVGDKPIWTPGSVVDWVATPAQHPEAGPRRRRGREGQRVQ